MKKKETNEVGRIMNEKKEFNLRKVRKRIKKKIKKKKQIKGNKYEINKTGRKHSRK